MRARAGQGQISSRQQRQRQRYRASRAGRGPRAQWRPMAPPHFLPPVLNWPRRYCLGTVLPWAPSCTIPCSHSSIHSQASPADVVLMPCSQAISRAVQGARPCGLEQGSFQAAAASGACRPATRAAAAALRRACWAAPASLGPAPGTRHWPPTRARTMSCLGLWQPMASVSSPCPPASAPSVSAASRQCASRGLHDASFTPSLQSPLRLGEARCACGASAARLSERALGVPAPARRAMRLKSPSQVPAAWPS